MPKSEAEKYNDAVIRTRAASIISILEGLYPDAVCGLVHSDPLQLLVSAQLSAQCTDRRVNIITNRLFERFRTAKDFAKADIAEIESYIMTAGLYHNKARNIKAACTMIIERFNGFVPRNMEDLLELPGVGRKTANLVLGDAYGIPGIVVDTHVIRLSNRLGLACGKVPEKLEYRLRAIIEEKDWLRLGHMLILHGRSVCTARKPDCGDCRLGSLCDHFASLNSKDPFIIPIL